MRSFINWDILQRIESSPREYIVQRNVALLESFLFGYENICLELNCKKQLEEKYSKLPSLEDFARVTYDAQNIGSRNFGSIISYLCEDERDYYHKYLDFLRGYETLLPVKETLRWDINEKSELSIKGSLRAMRQRYLMYFGVYDLARLRAFLDGYFLCKRDYKIQLDTFDLKIKAFVEQISCEDINLSGDFVTWDRKYTYDRCWRGWGEIENRKKIVDDFWCDLEEFTGNAVEWK